MNNIRVRADSLNESPNWCKVTVFNGDKELDKWNMHFLDFKKLQKGENVSCYTKRLNDLVSQVENSEIQGV
jgi:hypothetical protein